jgi:hypothetical protein
VRVSPSTAVTSPNLRMRFLVSITSASLSR